MMTRREDGRDLEGACVLPTGLREAGGRTGPTVWITGVLSAIALATTAALASIESPGETGADLVGTKARSWEGLEWLATEPLRVEDLRGHVVLVRWWTDSCVYCRRSAPALNDFYERHRRRGLIVIGIYHPKPIGRSISAGEIREAARERGFDFPIAIDRDWSVLRRWWLDGRPRSATSVSFLIDRDGVIRHIHPGPAYHREVVRGDEQPSQDFAEMDRMIEQLLEKSN